MKKVLGGLVLALASIAFAGPQDNSLVVASAQEPRILVGDFLFLNPGIFRQEIEGYLVAPLMAINVEGQPQPVLVREVPALSNGRIRITDIGGGKRRLELDFTLKPGLKWSDGDALDTEDVAFFMEAAKAKGMPLTIPDLVDRLNIRVKDKQNFTAVFEPAYYYDTTVSMALNFTAPSHLMRSEWEKTKAAAASLDADKDAKRLADLYQDFFTRFGSPDAINTGKMVYSGPFKATRWVAGSTLEMVRNPNFTAMVPEGGADKYVQKVTYRFFGNTNALVLAVIGGEVDATSVTGITSDQARSQQVTSRAPGNFDIWGIPGGLFETIHINKYPNLSWVKELGLDDKRTRQAMLYALNRQGWVEAFYAGTEPVANEWINPAHPLYTADVAQYPYNPQKASELLASMGWKKGADGILERSVGGKTVRFEVEFSTTAGNAVRERTQQLFIEQWKQVGILVKINNAPPAVLFSPNNLWRGEDGKWQLLMAGLPSSLQEDGRLFQYKNLNSGTIQVPGRDNNYSGINWGGWRNDEFDRLTSQATLEFDSTKRKELFAKAQQIWAEELPILPLRFQAIPLIVRSGLNNYVASGFSGRFGGPGWNAWEIGWASRGAVKKYDQAKVGGVAIK